MFFAFRVNPSLPGLAASGLGHAESNEQTPLRAPRGGCFVILTGLKNSGQVRMTIEAMRITLPQFL